MKCAYYLSFAFVHVALGQWCGSRVAHLIVTVALDKVDIALKLTGGWFLEQGPHSCNTNHICSLEFDFGPHDKYEGTKNLTKDACGRVEDAQFDSLQKVQDTLHKGQDKSEVNWVLSDFRLGRGPSPSIESLVLNVHNTVWSTLYVYFIHVTSLLMIHRQQISLKASNFSCAGNSCTATQEVQR
jgi:hypothetical protein